MPGKVNHHISCIYTYMYILYILIYIRICKYTNVPMSCVDVPPPPYKWYPPLYLYPVMVAILVLSYSSTSITTTTTTPHPPTGSQGECHTIGRRGAAGHCIMCIYIYMHTHIEMYSLSQPTRQSCPSTMHGFCIYEF